MKKLCILTPDCGDRPDFLRHCQYQMAKQTLKGIHHFVISWPPKNDVPDLTLKIRLMFEQLVKEQRFTHVAIIENDDYYPDNWLEIVNSFDFDLLGIETTYFYHLNYRKWKLWEHPGHSSLFCTAFKIEALLDYPWPSDSELYLDIHLWKTFNMRLNPLSIVSDCKLIVPPEFPIGIKHNIGFCPGSHHGEKDSGNFENDDRNCNWLFHQIKRPDSLNFYIEMMEEITYNKLGIIKPQ